MRSYDILDADGNVLRTEDLDDTLAPTLLAGQVARLVAINGEKLAEASRSIVGPVGLDGELPTLSETLVTEQEVAASRAEAARPHGDLSDADAAEPAAREAQSDSAASAEHSGEAADAPAAERQGEVAGAKAG